MDDKGNRVRGEDRALRLSAREEAVTNREARVSAQEIAMCERELVLCTREEQVLLSEEAASLQREIDEEKAQRERFMAQLRGANEKLVLAVLRSDELVEEARKARELATERATVEAEGRRRAEARAQELLATETVLRVGESQFRTLANTIPMLVWYANPDGHIAWYNQRWYDYTGMLFHEQVGWRWQSVVAPDDVSRALASWRAALASGDALEDTLRLRRNDGEFRWFLSRAHPLRDGAGRIVRWFGLMVDIDDQKRAGDRMRAESHAKDEFLAMLGHELRNPLAPILAALNLMAVSNPSVLKRERGIIERQVKHLVHLVDDLLDISRIAEGKLELQRKPMELADVVARAIEMVNPLFEKKAHHLRVDVPPRGLVIDGDATRLAQAICNLLANAAKYTPARGSIVVTGETSGSRVTLRVRDTGVGISAEMLPHVFELFTQEPHVLERSEGGLGLGLAIVRSLVTMHGGTATASSEGIGRGSEFVIELPASSRSCDSATLDSPVGGRSDPAGARKVLIVDDNPDVAEVIAVSLTILGHEVRVAYDGPSAIAMIDSFVPDVALLDIGLPMMDGYELAKRLRTLLSPHDIRFVAITGYDDAADRRRSREAGFALHLVKPVDVATLQNGVRGSDAAA